MKSNLNPTPYTWKHDDIPELWCQQLILNCAHITGAVLDSYICLPSNVFAGYTLQLYLQVVHIHSADLAALCTLSTNSVLSVLSDSASLTLFGSTLLTLSKNW